MRIHSSEMFLLFFICHCHASFSFSLPATEFDQLEEINATTELNASLPRSRDNSFADMIDKALEKEFTENEQSGDTDAGSFNNSVADQQAVLETVARVKTKKNDTKEEKSFQFHDVFNLENENRAEDMPTLIDRKDNVFIISNLKSKYPVLQLDLRLISDLVVVIVSATCGGIAFACAGQPVITGYLLAGSVIGPGGFSFVSEMVQVETVAQFGVIFLLFALGLEFSATKLRVVRAVAVLGGLLQIFLFMCLCGVTATLCGGKPSEGVFVGAFLSMSSTAVVLKFLMERNSINTLHGQVTVGTLILQDCAVGLLFALLPILGGDSILGIVSGVTDYMWNKGNASNVVEFNKVLLDLMTKLKTQAASGGSLRKFATGDASYANNFGRVYALVQCTPDLSQLQCNNCLGDAFLFIPKYLDGLEEGRVFGASCNFRYDSSLFYNSTSVDAPPPTTTTKGKDSNTSKLVIIIVVPTVISVILIVCVFFFVRKKKKSRDIVETVEDDIGTVESLQFNFDTIRVATDNFSHTNKLGQGGFGAVYKGTLPNGEDIAVKRLSVDSGQGDHEFKNEVLLLAKLQHRNLVRLRGFCLEGSERLLVYEFVPNTSLDHFIFDPIKRAQLDWERRYKIIGGIARGLLYLHEDSRLRIIHRDLKASNILVDAEMHPKIADFGMARLFVVDQTQGNTSRIVGTYGYMAPEYAMRGHFSVKSDVFSFGVLVLEIVSGQKNNCFHNGQNIEDLVCYAWENWREGTAQNLIDPTLTGSRTEIMRCIHIGLLCVQENVAARPTMNSIVLMLNSYSLTLPVPSQPPFSTHSGMDPEMPLLSEVSESDQSKSRSDKLLVNDVSIVDVSITELHPR